MVLLRKLSERSCYLFVSNTINIITYTDVLHDWQGRGGAGGVEGLLGRMGVGGGDR